MYFAKKRIYENIAILNWICATYISKIFFLQLMFVSATLKIKMIEKYPQQDVILVLFMGAIDVI